MSSSIITPSPTVGGVPAPPDRLIVFDTTLRDGEQSPGVHLTTSQKVEIALQLSKLGVDVCEVGFPACAVDIESVEEIVKKIGNNIEGRLSGEPMILTALARCVKTDIDAAWNVIKYAKKPRIHVFYATSDIHLQYKLKKTRSQALETIKSMVVYAKSICSDIEFSAEDATRTDFDFLLSVVIAAIEAGATTINIPDTVGYMLPHEYGELFMKLIIKCNAHFGQLLMENIIFSCHCHNDLGQAVSNTGQAIRGGARQIEVTINGIGERAGNAALEEIIMAVTVRPDAFPSLIHNINTKLLVPTSQLVAKYTGMSVQKNKAIVGENSFLHESGVHADGVLKNPATYEIYHSEQVGWPSNQSHIVLGKHSGRAAYKQALQEGGFIFDTEEKLTEAFQRFQTMVKKLASGQSPTWQQIVASATVAQIEQNNNNSNQEKKQETIPVSPSTAPVSAPTTSSPSLPPLVPKKNSSQKTIYNFVELIGDGVSTEVTTEAVRVLKQIATLTNKTFNFSQHPIGGKAIDLTGNPLPESTLAACKSSDGVLLGAVGDPKFDGKSIRPEQGLLKIRLEMQLYQNIRPVYVYPELITASPFNPAVIEGTDFIIMRELTGGIYNNIHKQTEIDAHDIMAYTVEEIERVVRAAADIARTRRKKLAQVDKANVLACSRLWRAVTDRVIKNEYPDITLEHMLVDSTAMHILKRPRDFDVLVMENLFGDILSDEAAALTASLGMLPSASIGYPNTPGLFEPVHGSAPDIAGKGIANPFGTILAAAMMLIYSGLGLEKEGKIIEAAVAQCIKDGIVTGDIAAKGKKSYTTEEVGKAVTERVAAALIAVTPSKSLSTINNNYSMNLIEKILCDQSVGLSSPIVRPGEIIVCRVSRTLASEMTWVGMSETYEYMGKPKLWRKDRFWLAIDHTVDPTNYNNPKQKLLIDAAESFAKNIHLDDYMGPNETILHTEFYRQRVIPSTIVVGADSHSCSAGCVGAYAVGLGAADTTMPLVTGKTFFEVPQTLLVHFSGSLPFGMTGKDVMLNLLKKIGRNTLALERAVEFGGDIKSLSVDSRFALSNMATELGGIAGVFPSDEITASFLAKRKKLAKNNNNNEAKIKIAEEKKGDDNNDIDEEDRGEWKNFRADPNASYAAKVNIDLNTIVPLIAKYPNPDSCYAIDDPEIDAVVPEIGRSIRKLDGVFIGACTTTEEEIILAALVLEIGLKNGLTPASHGTRKVSVGSRIMLERLKKIGIIDIYQQAGFLIGAPGCAYCLAVNGVDVAAKGSVWLSSQNRNFKNRMGPGSIGNLASAATVAASSFNMIITDPRPLLEKINKKKYEELLENEPIPESVPIHEPSPVLINNNNNHNASPLLPALPAPASSTPTTINKLPLISGRIQLFGDHIDTDAIIPGQLMLDRPLAKLGQHSFKYVRPNFVSNVIDNNQSIVVAGEGFGCGSSREEAVSCLKACGVKAVIAKSFSFIFGRNLLCLNLIGIIIKDNNFYSLAEENKEITIDIESKTVMIDNKIFSFDINDIQLEIYRKGGIIDMYKNNGIKLFQQLSEAAKKKKNNKEGAGGGCGGGCGSGNNNNDNNRTEEKNSVISW